MNRSTMACVAILVSACAPAAHTPAAPVTPSNKLIAPPAPVAPRRLHDPDLEGLYRASHATRYLCDTGVDGWCDADVEDLMAVSDHGNGVLGVHVLIAADNGHSCT